MADKKTSKVEKKSFVFGDSKSFSIQFKRRQYQNKIHFATKSVAFFDVQFFFDIQIFFDKFSFFQHKNF